MRFKSNMRRFVRWGIPSECPSHRSSLPYWYKTRRANFHKTLLWPTSDYQARLPWTETGGNHLVLDPDCTVNAKKPPIRGPWASGASPKMCVAYQCSDGRQFGLCWSKMASSAWVLPSTGPVVGSTGSNWAFGHKGAAHSGWFPANPTKHTASLTTSTPERKRLNHRCAVEIETVLGA